MGCDIHSVAIDAEGRAIKGGVWADDEDDCPGEPFGWRNYGVFGFLANVRNYSSVPPISEPRGRPDDLKYDDDSEYLGDHSFSWLSIEELVSFDYSQEIIDHRHGAELTTYRKFLGEDFFADLLELQSIGADRVVFGFDS